MNWEIAHQWWPLIWCSTILMEKIPKEPGICFLNSVELKLGADRYGFMLNAVVSLTTLSTLIISYREYCCRVSHGLGEAVNVGDLINKMPRTAPWLVPLISPQLWKHDLLYLPFKNLTKVLPPAWMKFIALSPNAFLGDHGLCLLCTSENLCVKTTKPKSPITISTSRLNSKQITIFCAMVILMAWCSFRQRKLFLLERSWLDIANEDFVLRAMGSTITFRDVMEATKYISEGRVVKKGAFGTTYKRHLKLWQDNCVEGIEAVDGETQIPQSFLIEIKTLQRPKQSRQSF